MTTGMNEAAPAMWRNSGKAVPTPPAPLAAEPGRPLIIRIGKRLRGLFDRMIAASSLVANDPVLDVRQFGWTALLRDQWQVILAEARAVALVGVEAEHHEAWLGIDSQPSRPGGDLGHERVARRQCRGIKIAGGSYRLA